MIQFTKSYKTDDNQVFGTIEEAQKHELETLLHDKGVSKGEVPSVAKLLIDRKDIIVDILTMTPSSKPKARSIHGGTKKRPSKTVVTDANGSVTSTVNTVTSTV